MRTATCCDCGAVYDAQLPTTGAPGHMEELESDYIRHLCPGDVVPAGRCTAKIEGEEFPCGMSCYLDDDHARAPISAPGSTVEDLENDLAALTVCLRLAEHGLDSFERNAAFEKEYAEELEAGTFEHETVAEECDREHDTDMARMYSNGAGAFEPSAVVAWLKERIAETENTIEAVSGLGMPEPGEEEADARRRRASGSRKGS